MFSVEFSKTASNVMITKLREQINVVTNEQFTDYFLNTNIIELPKKHRERLREKRKSKSNSKSRYVCNNEYDKSMGKTFKQRGYMYFNTSVMTDGVFVPSKPPERIIYLETQYKKQKIP